MEIDYKKLVSPYITTAINNLAEWIKIPSVLDNSSVKKGAPFGPEVQKALQYIGQLAENDGFNVDYCDGYCTEISFGNGPRTIGIYAHADVVPATGNWKHPAFGGQIDQGKMFGRGTSDDKGPAMSAYYALKALKDGNLINNFRVVLVIGGNEENGSRCLDYYFHILKKPYADFGFTPDGNFPLIYGEKAMSNFTLESDIDFAPISEINAGLAGNLVIDQAIAKVQYDENILPALETSGYSYQFVKEGARAVITIFGKSAHGSVPHLGDNAGLKLLAFLGEYYRLYPLTKIARLFKDSTGHELGVFCESEALHQTTLNVGIISYNNQHFSMLVNFRYPEIVEPVSTLAKIQDESQPFVVNLKSEAPYLLFNPESSFIKTLLNVYQVETGDYTHLPETIGGGTYAKEAKNTVAFGSAFPGRDDLIHSPDEHIHLSDFELSMALYAHAIYDLGSKDALKI
ncbi:MAG: Sapep family Mn(2+)-dependent dipeptidase [Bacilli bacterium]|jgi:succinyl-diaminopimelate desuccinylase